MIRKLLFILLILISCEDKKRIWDNPYDPRSDRSLWSPDELEAKQKSKDMIQLNWLRKGREFDGFRVEKSVDGETWKDSVATLGNYVNKWVDTLDMKLVVKDSLNKGSVEYSYRVYAFADTNESDKATVKYKPLMPGPPKPVDITSVSYTHIPTKKLTVKWEKLSQGSFKSYHLHHLIEGSTDTSIISINDIDSISYDINIFDPTVANNYWISAEDTTGLYTLGKSMANIIDEVPSSVKLDTITHKQGNFQLSWNVTDINDFKHYDIQDSNASVASWTSIKVINDQNQNNAQLGISNDVENYYRVLVSDVWNQTSASNIKSATSYRKIVKMNELSEVGDTVMIMSIGPTLDYSHFIYKDVNRVDVKGYFPFWIQGGEKIFSFTVGNAGFLIDQDGKNPTLIQGLNPENIAFSSDGKEAVFSAVDHNIYTVDLKDDLEIKRKLTTITNNEWYGDPEFVNIDGTKDSLIMYWQDKFKYNNNIGEANIYWMDEFGNLVKQLTKAANGDRLIMPRMSPDGAKILYYKEDDGLYVMNPSDEEGVAVTTNSSNVKVLPENSKYFRNITWAPNSERAVFWTYNNNSYFSYVFERSTGKARLLQSGARFASWYDNNTITYRSESANKMFMINVTSNSIGDPVLVYDSPWVDLQPRQ
tara:strand:+ start:2262 stop:4205 length:1944 start_codon:yes stop_codon:yes gene_type:complete